MGASTWSKRPATYKAWVCIFVGPYSKHMPVNTQGKQLEATQQVLAQAEIKLAAHGVSGFIKDHEKKPLQKCRPRKLTDKPPRNSWGVG
ncbi:MAG: hypothetical protein MK136_06820 [Pirellulaceae bacterium]|nr:hypothetical protein [Pirellulaceae bacterium]